jgi:hypothetical protein
MTANTTMALKTIHLDRLLAGRTVRHVTRPARQASAPPITVSLVVPWKRYAAGGVAKHAMVKAAQIGGNERANRNMPPATRLICNRKMVPGFDPIRSVSAQRAIKAGGNQSV